MKGEALFKSFSQENEINNIKNKNLRLIEETKESKIETNESYYKLGFNEINMITISNMELIHNKIEPNILDKLKSISKLITFEKFKEINETLLDEEGKENVLNNSDTNSTKEKRYLAQKNKINYSTTYTATYKLLNTDFLGWRIGLYQYLYINNNNYLRQEYLTFLFGGKEYLLSKVEKYHYPSLKSGYITKELLNKNFGFDKRFKPFGYVVIGHLNLIIKAQHGVSFDII